MVGYGDVSNFQQLWPWISVEGDPDIPKLHPTRLFPTYAIWSQFRRWSSMWHHEDHDPGPCEDGQDAWVCALRDGVTVAECNQEAQALSHAIHSFWGATVSVFWERIEDESRPSIVRVPICSAGG